MTALIVDDVVLTGSRRPALALEAFVVVRAESRTDLDAYARLRREAFVTEQEMFVGTDRDDVDDDPRAVVLVAKAPDGEVLGGVRLAPMTTPDLGWWRGSRLVVAPQARLLLGVGAALVRAACAAAEDLGGLRFDATIQVQNQALFARLGWTVAGRLDVHGHPHVRVEWPIDRIRRLAQATKASLGGLLDGFVEGPGSLGGTGFLGDDGAPVPGSDLVAACDAILPSMVERDPEWAGWCSVLVNVNDLSAMGARPVGLLDAVAARDASFARRILTGLRRAAQAWGVPVLGGHTQLGVPAALSVTALGRPSLNGLTGPVPGGGGRPGQSLRVTADLGGGWRPGYTGGQWDSSSQRTPEQLRALGGVVPALAPTAAKDVSMSGLVGTTGMLAEASGVRAVLDVASVPAPERAAYADWVTCFPGFAMVTAERSPSGAALPEFVTSAVCGELSEGSGVGLRWPDGFVTEAVDAAVTGLGAA